MGKNLKHQILEEEREKWRSAFKDSTRALIKNVKKPFADVPTNVKCDCGHTRRHHAAGTGWCHSSGHPDEGKCGCTFYHPNFKWIEMNNKRLKK